MQAKSEIAAHMARDNLAQRLRVRHLVAASGKSTGVGGIIATGVATELRRRRRASFGGILRRRQPARGA